MFQKMLVCSDGSPRALDAARTGAALAQQIGCSVVLLNVLDPGFLGGNGEAALSIAGSTIEDVTVSQQQALQSETVPVFAAAGITPQALSERGHPVEAIVAVAQREGCDLIVVGRQGQSDSDSFVFGSVAEGVLRHAGCSVLVVPGALAQAQEASAAPKFQRLLLASDASAGAGRATDAAIELAARFSAKLTIVNVYEGSGGLLAETVNAFSEYYPQEHEQRVIQAIEQSIQNAAGAGVVCTLHKETGHAAQTILRVAEQEKPDMIVVGHRGAGGFEAMLLGSVPGRVAQGAQCPVLVTR